MIACENGDCTIEWFHTQCLKILFPKENGIVLTVENYQNLTAEKAFHQAK